MTTKEAKQITLKVWRYIATHSRIESKLGLPEDLLVLIRHLTNRCPLCEVLIHHCMDCPLALCMSTEEGNPGLYRVWREAGTGLERKKAAKAIVAKVKAWKV